MATILDKILEQKAREVEALQRGNKNVKPRMRARYSIIEKLGRASEMAIIAEFKRASPSKGMINNSLDPAVQAKQYEAAGASAISVLTDETFFKGSYADLEAVREAVELPILCKDFIIDELQIKRADTAGADLILLIAAALEAARLKELHDYAASIGLEVLVEIHDEEDLVKAVNADAKLIGINNRDLRTFEVSMEATKKLGSLARASGAYVISESGIASREDALTASAAGASGLLIGESLMKSGNIASSFNSFIVPLLQEGKK